MAGFRQYVVTEQAAAQGRELGLGQHAVTRIERMAHRAAPFTHKLGNRRYEDFVLKMEGGQVLAIARLTPIRRHVRQPVVTPVMRSTRPRLHLSFPPP